MSTNSKSSRIICTSPTPLIDTQAIQINDYTRNTIVQGNEVSDYIRLNREYIGIYIHVCILSVKYIHIHAV
jgi:hypothetical protein